MSPLHSLCQQCFYRFCAYHCNDKFIHAYSLCEYRYEYIHIYLERVLYQHTLRTWRTPVSVTTSRQDPRLSRARLSGRSLWGSGSVGDAINWKVLLFYAAMELECTSRKTDQAFHSIYFLLYFSSIFTNIISFFFPSLSFLTSFLSSPLLHNSLSHSMCIPLVGHGDNMNAGHRCRCKHDNPASRANQLGCNKWRYTVGTQLCSDIFFQLINKISLWEWEYTEDIYKERKFHSKGIHPSI